MRLEDCCTLLLSLGPLSPPCRSVSILAGYLLKLVAIPKPVEDFLHCVFRLDTGDLSADGVRYLRILFEIIHDELLRRSETLMAKDHQQGILAFLDERFLESQFVHCLECRTEAFSNVFVWWVFELVDQADKLGIAGELCSCYQINGYVTR